MSKLSFLFCTTCVLFLAHDSDGIAFRSFKQKNSSSCSTETALAALGCPCALVGQRCRDFGSRCFGSRKSLIGNIGNGSPKLGVCACGSSYFLSPFTKTCTSAYIIIPSASADKCLFRNGAVTTVNVFGYTGPMKYALGVINTTVTPALTTGQANYYLTNPLVAIDTATNQVYAIESPITPSPPIAGTAVFTGFLPTVTSVIQCYQVVGIDANNAVTNPTTFCVTFAPMDPTCTCSARPCTTARGTCVRTCPVAL